MRTVIRLSIVTLAGAVALAAPAAAATSAELLSCQKAFESNTRSFAKYVATKVGACADKVVPCNLAFEIDAVDPTSCLASATSACAGVPAQVTEQQAKRAAKIVTACGLIPFAELQQFVAGLGFFNVVTTCGAATVNDLVDCVLADTRCSRERALFHADPRAQESLTDAGVAASFSCVAP